MDIYSDMRIPYSVGVWARSHKFNPISVQLTRDLQTIESRKAELQRRKEAVAQAEESIEMAEEALKTTITRAEKALAEDSHGY